MSTHEGEKLFGKLSSAEVSQLKRACAKLRAAVAGRCRPLPPASACPLIALMTCSHGNDERVSGIRPVESAAEMERRKWPAHVNSEVASARPRQSEANQRGPGPEAGRHAVSLPCRGLALGERVLPDVRGGDESLRGRTEAEVGQDQFAGAVPLDKHRIRARLRAGCFQAYCA